MKLISIGTLFVIFLLAGSLNCDKEEDDNDFSEFEDFDTDDDFVKVSSDRSELKGPGGSVPSFQSEDAEDDGVVEDEDSEFDHFTDEEEFEGFNKDTSAPPAFEKTGEPKLTVANVPLHFSAHWKSYWMEMIMIAGLLAYFGNYFVGRSKNSKIASHWLQTHRTLLEENFAMIGDDTQKENQGPDGFIKESESVYTLWCSGRTCCEGMLVELKLIRRQDLVAIISDIMKPSQDQLHIKIELSSDIMDPFVFCVATKKTASKFFKEMYDLSKFCILVNNPETKYNVPTGMSVLSEIPEASSAMLDSRVTAMMSKYGHLIDYIYVSDQYNGVISQEDQSQQLKMPDVKKQLSLGFNLPNANDMESTKPLMVLVFYLLEKIKRYRLSKEGVQKAEKNRQRVEEEFMKSTHAARAEAAALRREEKRKLEKERVMAEDDPEKQRRWEKKEQKRQQKRNQPKMKQLSVKAL
ncbi:coiled-coil domain-containing protein 47 [Contarinia nasturtii]|uniref:coiled-coil domain-containing protein 47 n=1 Tax=Contarinia nasturtii TaxID=265458 RepID=UPI0012D3B747|nr:coiled-coil domain-containing protein 47 [Contarinia nasturtii]XP_031619331.1 coiled-coil domain-containing protein 47 [Contarinia nasturtii]